MSKAGVRSVIVAASLVRLTYAVGLLAQSATATTWAAVLHATAAR